MKRFKYIFLFILLILNGSAVMYADDFYVDAVNGSDTEGDGSQAHPWRRLQFAIDSIEGSAENPHTIHLAPGIYGPSGNGESSRIYGRTYISITGNDIRSVFVGIPRFESLHGNIPIRGVVLRSITMTALEDIGDCEILVDRCIVTKSLSWGINVSDAHLYIKNSVIAMARYGF